MVQNFMLASLVSTHGDFAVFLYRITSSCASLAECYCATENKCNPASVQSRMEFRLQADSGPILHAYCVRCSSHSI